MQVLIIEILIRGNGESHLASSPSEYEPLQVADLFNFTLIHTPAFIRWNNTSLLKLKIKPILFGNA